MSKKIIEILQRGIVLVGQRQLAEATECFRQAVGINPKNASAHYNLGNVLKDQGQWAEAAQCYRQALALNPKQASAYNNLGISLASQGQWEEAVECYRETLRIDPHHANALNNLGNVWNEKEQFDAAIDCYQRALQCNPHFAQAYINLGLALEKVDKLDAAIACHQKALNIKPGLADAILGLTNALEKQEKLAEARAGYQELLRSNPTDISRPLWQLRLAGICPAVFDSAQAIDEYRRNLLRAITNCAPVHLEDHLVKLHDFSAQPPFKLLYHGLNNRPIKEAYAQLFRYGGPGKVRPVEAARPQVGLVVTPSHEGIFLRFWQEMLARMKLDRFQIVIICGQTGEATIRAGLKNDAVRLLVVPNRLDQVSATVREARLDVLYYWEVGSDSTNYFLPFMGLAAVQCTSQGIQDTSGIAHIDYYLSSDLIEPEGAQVHYTEKLIRAKTLLTYHLRPNIPDTLKPREAFGLVPGQHLYLCAQNIRKFHPDFDPILGGILKRDAGGTLVIVEDLRGYLADKLRQRFAATIPEVADRIVFLPWQAYPDYLSLVSAADVILDPLHYNGGTTNYESLALKKPVVTWPGPFQISRTVLAFYRKMGIKGCVAGSAEEYIAIAVELGTNADYREAVGREIADAGGELFEDQEAVEEHEELFERLVEEARST